MAGETAIAGAIDNTQQFLKRENVRLQALVSELRTASPSVARLTDLAVWREREAFEEKQGRALVLLRKKDAKIRELGEAVARHNNISRQRAVDGRSTATAGLVRPGGAGAVGGKYGGGGGRGNRESDNNAATAAVVQRLETCVEEQANQIEALLEEVVKLRSTQNDTSHHSTASDGDNGAIIDGERAGSPEVPRRALNTAREKIRRQQEGARGGREGRELPTGAGLVDNLRSQVEQLESALSTQAAALAERDAALERTSEEYREREERLAERVDMLERLQETARRTVLDREERLRKAEAEAATVVVNDAVTAGHGDGTSSASAMRAGTADARVLSSVATDQRGTGRATTAADIPAAAAAAAGSAAANDDGDDGYEDTTARRGVGPVSGGSVRARDNRDEDHFATQEWWLHLAAAEKKREEREQRESHEVGKTKPVSRGGGGEAIVGGSAGGGSGKEVRRLHRLLEEQGLEVVALRQRVLKAEIVAREKGKGLDRERRAVKQVKRHGAIGTKAAISAGLEGSSRRAQSASLAEMEGRVAALHAQGDVREALVVAREAVSAMKLALLRSEGEVELHVQLLEEEKRRSVAALSRAEDLQGKMDRIAVEETLRGVSGGAVSASALIDRFAGTLFRESRRVKGLQAEIGTMRTRCARLARVARGDFPDADPPGPPVTGGAGFTAAGLGERAPRLGEQAEEDESWVEAGVQEAAVAMETGRRRALEEEVECLKNEVLAERQRADEAQRDAKDERRIRSLAPLTSSSLSRQDDNNDDDAAALRQQLKLASSEVEALRTHNKDLRTQIQSGWWSWQKERASFGTAPDSGDGETVGVGGKTRFSDGSSSGACAAAEAALRELGVVVDIDSAGGGGGGGSGHDSSVAMELDRLTSLLAERDAQVSVLISTVEALHTLPAFVPSSPRKSGDAAPSTGDNKAVSGDTGGRAYSPRLRAHRDDHAQQTTNRVSPRAFGTHFSGDTTEAAAGGGGGVGVLNHVGAQGLARRCVSLTVRLTSAIAREGKAQRQADRLADENARQERKMRAAKAIEADLTRRNRVLDNGARKTAAALSGLRTESAARLREAGEEASKLRSALRDAEIGAGDAHQRLACARAEGHALAVELQACREKRREEIIRISQAHDASIKECADRLLVNEDASLPQLPRSGLDLREGERGPAVTTAAALSSSPVAAAIAKLSTQWRAFAWQETEGASHVHHSKSGRHRQRTSTAADISGTGRHRLGQKAASVSGRRRTGSRGREEGQQTIISERQLLATTTFLQETATRIDAECSRAVRRARAMEWELARARRGELDATTALEEAREEVCRLSARTAVAEAAVTAALPTTSKPSSFVTAAPYAGHHATPSYSVPENSRVGGGGGGGNTNTKFGADSFTDSRGCSGEEAWKGVRTTPHYYTVAAVSLLEKRFAAAVEDLTALRATSAAALAGEAAANARAEQAEAMATMARADADVLAADLERHKVSTSERATAEVAEWRREIRVELGRWWQDDLLALHNGVALDWGSAGLADDTAEAWRTPVTGRNRTTTSTASASAATLGSLHLASGCIGGISGGGLSSSDCCNVRHGISGEEAMAQALIAGRAEQAYLEDRSRANERRVEKLRRETLRLRAVLERWHGDFVASLPLQARQKRGRLLPENNPGDSAGTLRRGPASAISAGVGAGAVAVGDGNGALERKLLAATAGLLGVREEAAGLRREVASLQALVARLREDESDARETAGRRVESARETARRRAEGDLGDAAERLEEERERFKSQLGAAHAEILRLGAQVAELKKRRNQDERHDSQETAPQLRDSSGDGDRGTFPGDSFSDGRTPPSGGSRKRPADVGDDGARGSEARGQERERERALRRGVEGEREALRQMCNGLAVDLKEAVEARSEVEDEREALVQEAAKAKAEAKTAGLARENLEVALKELARLLEFAREAAGSTRGRGDSSPGRTGGVGDEPLNTAALSSRWDRSKEEAKRFARVMVAAKVAEADLLRRLQGASSSEADLRHMLRRRDIRIEELKRDQGLTDRLGRSIDGGGYGGTAPWSTLASSSNNNNNPHQRPLNLSLRESGSTSAARAGLGGSAAGDNSRARAVASEQVALRATVKRLELELAEAAARGEVGDAATRAAERLAARLFPEAVSGGGGLTENGCCRTCGVTLETGGGKLFGVSGAESESSHHGRGALFLIPNADVERKATAVAADAASVEGAAAEAENTTATAAVAATAASIAVDGNGTSATENNVGPVTAAVEAVSPARRSSTNTASSPASAGAAAVHGGERPTPPYAEVLPAFSSGERSLEANLERLEAVAACGGCGCSGSAADGGAGGFARGRSASPAGGKKSTSKIHAAWAEAVRELRVQVAAIRHRIEATEELLEEERACKGILDEEVLRLRTELLKQQRSYWHATATLKDRYEGGPHENEQESNGEKISCSHEAAASGEVAVVAPAVGTAEGAAEMARAISTGGGIHTGQHGQHGQHGQQQQQQHVLRSPSSLGKNCVDEQLRDKEEELRDVRASHSREARDVAAELASVIEAHRARVATLEDKLRRTRRSMKAMAHPKPSARRGREPVGRAGVGDGGGVGGYPAGVVSTHTPLSTDELLNLLAAADEEVFEAKGKMQRLEHELRLKTAEVDALLPLREGGGGGGGRGASTTASRDVPTEKECAGGSITAGDSQASALAPQCSAAVAAAAAAAVGTTLGTAATATGLANVAHAARLASAEAQVETLREECLAAGELAIRAQREASALRLAAQRKTADRADEGRSREKELRRQVSAYKREAERLRSATAGVTAGSRGRGRGRGRGRDFPFTARKSVRGVCRPGDGGAGANNTSAAREEEGEEEAEAALLKRRTQQLCAAREESQRRGRTINALRAMKTAQDKDLQQLRQEAADLGEKLARALKDVGVKSNAAKALREKVVALGGELAACKAARTNPTAMSGSTSSVVVAGAQEGGTEAEPPAPLCDVQTATIRELRAERDRLRASMRGWHGSLSKKTTEIGAQVLELERLEQEASALRAAVARKDDAYRSTKKQLVCVREEFRQLKDGCHRWRADADAKWRSLKRASEAALRRAKTCEKSGDAAERELAALKSAFRSFLKTLWDDLRARPPPNPPVPPPPATGTCEGVVNRTGNGAGCESGNDGGGGGGGGGGRVFLRRVSGNAGPADDGDAKPDLSGNGGVVGWTEGGPVEVMAAPTRLFGATITARGQENRCREEGMFAGLAKTAAAMDAAAEEAEGRVAASPIVGGGGGGEGSPFGELTEGEVSDIMQALSVEVEEGDSCFTSSSRSRLHGLPIAAAAAVSPPAAAILGELSTSALSPHHRQQQQQQQQQQVLPSGLIGCAGGGKAMITLGQGNTKQEESYGGREFGVEKNAAIASAENGVGKEEERLVENHGNVEPEGKEAFADRVEAALGGSNPSAALADMLRSLRASSFSKAVGDGILSDGGGGTSLAGQESSSSRSSSHPGTAAAAAAASAGLSPDFNAGDPDATAVPRPSAFREQASGLLAEPARLGSTFGGVDNNRVLSPLEEVPSSSASSPSETAAASGRRRCVDDSFETLLVEDLASP